MSYVDNYIQSLVELEEECRRHIFPVFTPNPRYLPLKLLKFSGALVFLVLSIFISLFVLFAEIVYKRRTTNGSIEENENWNEEFHIQYLHIDKKFSRRKRKAIFEHYSKLLEVIDSAD